MEFEKLKEKIKDCRLCKEKFGFEPNPVVFGKRTAKIVQISQAPSANVHITGKPFTDLSGKKLKYEWYQITDDVFYDENNFYISALAHCFPGKTKNGGDRLPPKICYDTWVEKELKLLDNELYIIIGAKAANTLFPEDDYNELIFKDNLLNGKKTIVLPHPSPLNIKWFKDNPQFYKERLIQIRDILNETLGGEKKNALNGNTEDSLSK